MKPLLSLEKYYSGLYFGQKGEISLARKCVAGVQFLSIWDMHALILYNKQCTLWS